MKAINLIAIAVAAAMLASCSFGETKDELVSVAPVPVDEPTTSNETVGAATVRGPAQAKSDSAVQIRGPHIDASAFLNALVESGCQIDKAEYKEVTRGGAIKIVCSKTVDALNVDIGDL